MPTRILAAVGTALTTFLAVSALFSQLLVTRIAFSVFVAVPVALFTAAIIGWLTFTRFWSDPDQRPALAGGAAIGYTILALSGIRYVSAGARQSIPLDTLVGVAGGVGLVVFLVVWRATTPAGDGE